MAEEGRSATRVLEQIESHLAKQNIRLGFCDSPYGEFIYANNRQAETWYLWDHQNEKADELKPCLRCLIKNLTLFVKPSDEFGNTVKLHVHVDAGRKYVIEAGIESQFSLSLLNKIAVADKQMLSKPVYIKAEPAKKTLFGNLYNLTGDSVYVEDYDKDAERIYQRACGNLGIKADEWPDPDDQGQNGQGGQQQGQGQRAPQPRDNRRSQNQGRQRRSKKRSRKKQGQRRKQQGGQKQQQNQGQNWVANLSNQREPDDQEWKELWSEFHELGIELHGREKWVNSEFPSLRKKHGQRFIEYDLLVEEIDNLDRELTGGAPPGFQGAFEPDDDLPFS